MVWVRVVSHHNIFLAPSQKIRGLFFVVWHFSSFLWVTPSFFILFLKYSTGNKIWRCSFSNILQLHISEIKFSQSSKFGRFWHNFCFDININCLRSVLFYKIRTCCQLERALLIKASVFMTQETKRTGISMNCADWSTCWQTSD